MQRILRLICLGSVSLLLFGQSKSNPKSRFISPTKLREPSVTYESRKNSVGVLHPEEWPKGANFIEAESLPLDSKVPLYPDDKGDNQDDNGRRVLGFRVQPGEKLEFTMIAENDKVILRTFIPNPPPPVKWKAALLNANLPLRSRRSKRLEIQNPTSDPQVLVLIVYGVCGNSYHLDLVRSPGS